MDTKVLTCVCDHEVRLVGVYVLPMWLDDYSLYIGPHDTC